MLPEVSSDQARLLRMLFPHLDGLEFVQVEAEDTGVVIVARTASGPWPAASAQRPRPGCTIGISEG